MSDLVVSINGAPVQILLGEQTELAAAYATSAKAHRDLARLYAISDTDAPITGAVDPSDRGAKYYADLAASAAGNAVEDVQAAVASDVAAAEAAALDAQNVLPDVKAALGNDLTDVVTDSYGQTTPAGTNNSTLNASYGPNVTITRPILLTELGVDFGVSGDYDLIIRAPDLDVNGLPSGTWNIRKLQAMTASTTGPQVFTAANGVPAILMLPGEKLLVRNRVARLRVTTTGAGQLRVPAPDTTVEGQTGVTAAVATTSGETAQVYFKGRALDGTTFDSRIEALELRVPRPLGEENVPQTVVINDRFTSTTELPAEWTATDWVKTVNGIQSPAPGAAWTTRATHGAPMMWNEMSVIADVNITDLTAVHGIMTAGLENSENGTAVIVNPATSKLDIYSNNNTTGARTLRSSSAVFASTYEAGKHLLIADRDKFFHRYRLYNKRTGDLVVEHTLEMLAAADAGSRPRLWGPPGYVVNSGAAGAVTLEAMSVVANNLSSPKIAIVWDSNGEGPTMGANYEQGAAYQVAAKLNAIRPGSCMVTARGGDETLSFTKRQRFSLGKFRNAIVVLMLGTNDGNSTVYRTNLAKIIAYCQSLGSTVVLCDVLPRGTAGSADQLSKNAFNTDHHNKYWGDFHLISIAAATTINGDRVTMDTSLFDPDLVHLNLAGHNRVAQVLTLELARYVPQLLAA